jgi:hypothetical protein
MEQYLRTWRLTPSKDSDLWSQSSYRGEVWVRAYDALEARKLTAQRFRVRSDRRRERMEGPWYARELTRCELDESPQFDWVQTPRVVSPAPDGKRFPETTGPTAEKVVVTPELPAQNGRKGTRLHSQLKSHDLVALDIRQAIVTLLVAKEIDVAGRWLDVYAASAADNEPIYIIIPAPRLKGVIAESIASLLDRKLDAQETNWILRSDDIEKLLGGGGGKLQAA